MCFVGDRARGIAALFWHGDDHYWSGGICGAGRIDWGNPSEAARRLFGNQATQDWHGLVDHLELGDLPVCLSPTCWYETRKFSTLIASRKKAE